MTTMTKSHRCERSLPERLYGKAVDYCYESDGATRGPTINQYEKIPPAGTFWTGNKEYESQVNYCPFCGAKAPTQVL